MRSFMIRIPGQYCSRDQIENNEMGVASSTYGGEKIDLSENTDVDGWIILRWIFRKWGMQTWTGWIWLKIGTGGGHL
jgi:hypothetical protein